MRIVEALHKAAIAVLVGLPVVLIVLDAFLRWVNAREDNVLVSSVADAAEALTPGVLTSVFHDQEHWQTVLLTLMAYALLALVITLVFSAIGRTADAVGTSIAERRERRRKEQAEAERQAEREAGQQR